MDPEPLDRHVGGIDDAGLDTVQQEALPRVGGTEEERLPCSTRSSCSTFDSRS